MSHQSIKKRVTETGDDEQNPSAFKEYTESILASMADGLIVIDTKGVIQTVNQSALRMLGYPDAGGLIGLPIGRVFVEEEEEEEEEEVSSVLKGIKLETMAATGFAENIETVVLTWEGTRVPVIVSGSVLGWNAGKATGAVFVFKDITERKRTENELKEREARLRSILENALDAIITLDKEGLVKELNPAAEKLFGYSREESIGRDIADFIVPPESREAHRTVLACFTNHASKTGKIPNVNRRIELKGLRSNGERVDLEVGLTAVMQSGNLHYTAFIHDITERKQLIKSLEETLDVAESANRAKSEFLANMSHEIRSPMNAIMGMTELVLLSNLTEDQRANLEIVQNSADSLLGLINDILDFSKIEAGRLILERITFDPRGRIEKTCDGLAIQAHQKEIELYCDMEPDIPTLVGDPLRLNQVLVNLLSNAIKFTSEGEVTLRVKKMPEHMGDGKNIRLHFSVTDTGIGIPPDRMDSIFEQFTQADGSTTRRYGGTGLGLTISKHLVEMMDGEIWVESKLGEGSFFHFTARFEVGQRAVAGSSQDMEVRLRQIESSHMAGVRVLVGDHNDSGRRIVKEMLTRYGADVEEAVDAPSLQESLLGATRGDRTFDVVLLDHGLLLSEFPDFGQLWNHITAEKKTLLMTPANIRMVDLTSAPQFGNVAFLKKPVRLRALLREIDRILGRPMEEAETKPDIFSKPRLGTIPLHILLIEDLVNNQKLATTILERAGYTVILVNNGPDALQRMATDRFDLILLDLHMPGMDGYEVTRRIREEKKPGLFDPRIPIIAVTAWAMETEEKKCLAAGMDGYLRKPYRAAELLLAIEPFSKTCKADHKKKSQSGSLPILTQVDMDPDTFQTLRRVFLEEGPGHLQRLQQGLRNRRVTHVLKAADRVKTDADNVGAHRVKIEAIRLKGTAQIKDWVKTEAFFNDLGREFQKAVQALSRKEEDYENSNC